MAVERTIMLSRVRVRELGRAQQWPLASRQMRKTTAESAGVLLRKDVAAPTPWPPDGHVPWLSVIPNPSSGGKDVQECQTRDFTVSDCKAWSEMPEACILRVGSISIGLASKDTNQPV